MWLCGSLAVVLLATACDVPQESEASKQAQDNNERMQSQVYVQHNNVEFQNYNDRQKVADDPATILWCTAYPTNPNARPVTVPIRGKLTSSDKRPYATTTARSGATDSVYSPEIPGPDGMYGSSVPYRYGFTPAGVYVDFTDLQTVCTTEPTVYQSQQTELVLRTDQPLSDASAKARTALQAGNPGEAARILEQATGGH